VVPTKTARYRRATAPVFDKCDAAVPTKTGRYRRATPVSHNYSMFGVRLDLSHVWKALKGAADRAGGEGGEGSLPDLHSPRPAELTPIEATVLEVLARVGDYSTFDPNVFVMGEGRAGRLYTTEQLVKVCKDVADPSVTYEKPLKRPRGDAKTFPPTKLQMLGDLHRWLHRRPSMRCERWVEMPEGPATTVLGLFRAYAMRQCTRGQQGAGAGAAVVGTPEEEEYAGGTEVDEEPGDVTQNLASEDPVESPDPFAPFDSEVPGDYSEVGSDDGEAPRVREGEVVENHATSFIMDDEVSQELGSYAVAPDRAPFVAFAPTELRGRLSHFIGSPLATDLLVGDENARRSRLVRGGIASNWSIWATEIASDQKWDRHGWTREGGNWSPPPSSPSITEPGEPPVPDVDAFGLTFGIFALHNLTKMISPAFISCLVARTNERLMYERNRMRQYSMWLLAMRAGREPTDDMRQWTFVTSRGEERRRVPTPGYLIDTDEEGRHLFADVTPMEMIRYLGLLIACKARSGPTSLNMLADSQSSLLAWTRAGPRPRVLARQRRQGISYLLSGESPYDVDFSARHATDTGCTRVSPHWRFREAYKIFNAACLEHAPRPIHFLAYDEFRHGYLGRLPMGMRRPPLHKAQGTGYDEILMCTTGGYRLHGEIDFGTSKWARSDDLANSSLDGSVSAVPRDRRLLRIARHVRGVVAPWGHIFADNLFTKLGAIRALLRLEYFYTGTTKRVAVNYGLPRAITEWAGTSGESLGLYDVALRGSQTCAIAWRDHAQIKTVLTLSSFYKADDISSVQRWDPDEQARVERRAPNVVSGYNAHMGYVDQHSQISQGVMTCRQKTRRWTQAAFHDMLDSQLANAFILSNRAMQAAGRSPCDHRAFLAAVAHIFCGVPHSGTPPADFASLAGYLRAAYGLASEECDPISSLEIRGASVGSRQASPSRPLLLRVNHPSLLTGISPASTAGQVHWPWPLPTDRVVGGVRYPQACMRCDNRGKYACVVCRLSACWACHLAIHQAAPQHEDNAAARAHRAQIKAAYQGSIRAGREEPQTVPLRSVLRGEEGEDSER